MPQLTTVQNQLPRVCDKVCAVVLVVNRHRSKEDSMRCQNVDKSVKKGVENVTTSHHLP